MINTISFWDIIQIGFYSFVIGVIVGIYLTTAITGKGKKNDPVA